MTEEGYSSDPLVAAFQQDPDRLVTVGEVRVAAAASAARHARSWRRQLWLYLITVLLFGGVFFLQQHQRADMNTYIHVQCNSRRAAVLQYNAFYARMTDLEASNKFIDQALRDARTAAYRGQQIPVPVC